MSSAIGTFSQALLDPVLCADLIALGLNPGTGTVKGSDTKLGFVPDVLGRIEAVLLGPAKSRSGRRIGLHDRG